MAIYIKLVKELSDSKWRGFNGTLASCKDVQDKLKEYGRPVEHWTDKPEEYFIMGFDPAEPAE